MDIIAKVSTSQQYVLGYVHKPFHSSLISDAYDGLSAGVELSCNGGDRYAVLQQICHSGQVIGS